MSYDTTQDTYEIRNIRQNGKSRLRKRWSEMRTRNNNHYAIVKNNRTGYTKLVKREKANEMVSFFGGVTHKTRVKDRYTIVGSHNV